MFVRLRLSGLGNLLATAGLITCFLTGDGNAAVRELKQSELRHATTSGGAIRLKRVIRGVEKVFGGTPVDARAFESDQDTIVNLVGFKGAGETRQFGQFR